MRERSWMAGAMWLGLPVAVALFALAMAAAAPVEAQAQNHASFSEDVAPILYENCVACHREGSIAPFSLIDYGSARRWARRVKEMVVERRMPPYFVDKTVGIQHFSDDRSLSDDEIATIAAWVDAGAPEGNPDALPPTPDFPEGVYSWTLAKAMGRPPDHIISMPEAMVIPGDGGNMFPISFSETGLDEDVWVAAFETKPSVDGFPVVHHNGTTLVLPDGTQEEFGEYALGKTGDILPEGTGRFIPSGTKIRWSSHYSGSRDGETHTDQSQLALWLYPKDVVPKHRLDHDRWGFVGELDIPAGEEGVRSDGFTVLDQNVRITTYQPHLHNLGERQCLEVIYPDSSRQTLNCVSWDFGWHIAYNYEYDSQPLIPKGSVLHYIHWHNNSESNPWAADTDNWVGWGSRSTDDMAHSHMLNYKLSDEEFEQAVKERMEKLAHEGRLATQQEQ